MDEGELYGGILVRFGARNNLMKGDVDDGGGLFTNGGATRGGYSIGSAA